MKLSRYETAYRQMFDPVINVGQARSSPIIMIYCLKHELRISKFFILNQNLKSAIRNSIPEKNQDPKCYILSCQIFPRILS